MQEGLGGFVVESIVWLSVLLYSSESKEKKTALIIQCEQSFSFLLSFPLSGNSMRTAKK